MFKFLYDLKICDTYDWVGGFPKMSCLVHTSDFATSMSCIVSYSNRFKPTHTLQSHKIIPTKFQAINSITQTKLQLIQVEMHVTVAVPFGKPSHKLTINIL